MNKRIEYIDFIKAIAIFAMVFAHCGLRMSHSDERLEGWIHLWHMPVFFIISGMVLNRVKWIGWNHFGAFFVSRFKSLIVPFVIWGTICNVWIFTLLNICGIGGGKWLDIRLALLNYIDYNIVTISGTSWFLPAMFLTELVFILIVNVIGLKKWSYLLYTCIVGIGLITITQNRIDIPLALDVLPFTLGFFAIGVIFQTDIQRVNLSKRALIIMAIILVGCYWIPGLHCNIRTSSYQPLYIGWLVCLCISLVMIFMAKHVVPHIQKMKIYSFVKETGQNTLVIYLLHMEVLRILPLQKLGGNSMLQTTIIQILVTISVLYIMIVASRLIRKYLPWTLGKSK